ncbi:MAG: hypothetical protein K2G88_00505 [Oscillospiraceae bacterium]|nr:hypothetical protein [Oscillospiraceae bacterium]
MNWSEVSIDTWVSTFGLIFNSILIAASIITSAYISRKEIIHKNKELAKNYYDDLLSSLPSFDSIKAQADYFEEDDQLLGGFASADAKIQILEARLHQTSDDEDRNIRRKIQKHKEYLEYWKQANDTIEKFMNSNRYNTVKFNCDTLTISCYYEFIVAFHNEHFYCGPVINTGDLQQKMIDLNRAIGTALKALK